jgi:hypothetical protein
MAGTALNPQISVRAEYAGGISVSKDGRQEGVDYTGNLKLGRAGAFVDWHPFSGSFRLTGGLTANDISAKLHGKGGNSTINGKPVDLSNQTFDVAITYPKTSPYLGLGWGHHDNGGGLSFFADLGVQFGKFKVDATTSVVGTNGITQADVDAEVAKARDAISKLSVLPAVSIGIGYQF